MYLFQLFEEFRDLPEHYHLHSTMYLFQLLWIPAIRVLWLTFTFHYVSISTDYYTEFWLDVPTFTFHYVSISTQFDSNDNWDICIYIPLCIYFNVTYLFIDEAGSEIYIPLCIYFNIIPARQKILWYHIYIPLCIYFNQEQQQLQLPKIFNLHSTMYLFQRHLS